MESKCVFCNTKYNIRDYHNGYYVCNTCDHCFWCGEKTEPLGFVNESTPLILCSECLMIKVNDDLSAKHQKAGL